eukprot:SAG31_NODE_2882_length_4955_cov_22.807455_4_plen_699_part_00
MDQLPGQQISMDAQDMLADIYIPYDILKIGAARWMDDAVGQRTLTELDICGRQLQSLPAEIGWLQALQNLNLYDNQLQELPVEIGGLQALQNLNLSHNMLQALPVEIGWLQALQNLNLYDNQLQSLPAEIGGLQALQNLNLEENQLQELPVEIGGLQALQNLNLSHNKLQALPVEIGGLRALQDLNLAYNQLEALPGAMVGLEIKTLTLADNLLPADRSEWWQQQLASPFGQRDFCDVDGMDLVGIDLSGRDLAGIDLSHADLSHATLRGATITATTKMDGSTLNGVDFGGAEIRISDFSGWNLTGAKGISREYLLQSTGDLVGLDLRGADVSEKELSGRLKNRNLSGATLVGATITDPSELDGATLRGTDFTGVDLGGKDLKHWKLAEAKLGGAKLFRDGEVKLDPGKLPADQLSGADLTGANFEGKDLSGINLESTVLTEAKFKDAKGVGSLQGATFGPFKPPSKRPSAQSESWIQKIKRLLGGEVAQGLVAEAVQEVVEELDLEACLEEVSDSVEDFVGNAKEDIEAAYGHMVKQATKMLEWVRDARAKLEELYECEVCAPVETIKLVLSTKKAERQNLTVVSADVSRLLTSKLSALLSTWKKEGLNGLCLLDEFPECARPAVQELIDNLIQALLRHCELHIKQLSRKGALRLVAGSWPSKSDVAMVLRKALQELVKTAQQDLTRQVRLAALSQK